MVTKLSLQQRFSEHNPDQQLEIVFFVLILPAFCYGFVIWFIFFSGLLGSRDSFILIILPLFFSTGFLYGFGKNLITPDKLYLDNEHIIHRTRGDWRIKTTKMHWEEVVAVITTKPKDRKIVFIESRKQTIGCGYGFAEADKDKLMDILKEMQKKFNYQIIEDVGMYDVFSIIYDIADGKPITIPEPVDISQTDDFIQSIQSAKILAYSITAVGFGALVLNYVVDADVLLAFSISMMAVGLAILVAIHFALKK